VLALLAPLSALASDGFVTRDVSLRAGPDSDYPRITVIESGTPIEVLGCIDQWSWCDVVAYNERGWVFGRYVELEYQGRRGYVSSYGPQVGIPIIAFALGTYWGSHYSDRDWYHHRDDWAHSSHGHRPNYTYSSYNSYGGSRSGTSSGYRKSGYSTNSGYRAPAQSTTQRSTTYQQSRTQATGYRGPQVVTQPAKQGSYTQERRDGSGSSRGRTPAQDRESVRQERSTYNARQAQEQSRSSDRSESVSNGRGAQGPTRSLDKGQAGSNAREPQGPSRSNEHSRHNRPAEGQAVERTEVARQNQPVAQPRQKQGPQQGHKPDKAEKNDKDDKDDGKGKKDGKN
jgi:uncharacterized protein YraI